MILPDRLIAIAGLMKEKNIVLFKNHYTSISLLQPLLFSKGWQSNVASGKFYFDQVVSSWEVTKQRCGSEGNWLYVGGKSSLLSMRCCCCEAASLLYYPRGALIGLHEWWKMTIYWDREIQVAESEKYIFHNNRNTQGNVASSYVSLGPGGSGRVTLVGENDIMYKCKWQDFF